MGDSFFQSLYEMFISNVAGLTEQLRELNLYGFTGRGLLISSFICCVLFYWIINHPRFNRFIHWIIILSLDIILAIIISLFYLGFVEVEYEGEYKLYFVIISIFLSTIFFTIFSFIIRWSSRNCSATPYPL